MIGRVDERAQIVRLLHEARTGRSGCLLLSGEPGVGKSTLLAYAVEQAADMRTLRSTGVETEVDLAFAGLDQLVRPVLQFVERLPARQADALRGALGLSDHASHDRFLVAAAILSLLSEAAEDDPVLVVIDDAQWLDQPSREAIAFAARRLEAEGIVLLAATRDDPWPGLPLARIGGLERDDAAQLLRELAGEVGAEVRDRLIGETAGNPLALTELAQTLSARQIAGGEPLPQPLPLTDRVHEAFLARARSLPEQTQTILLVAAADDTADPSVVFRAAGQLGVDPAALEAAERAGLAKVDGGDRIVFRHPLVRAAVYRGATFAGRVEVHRALAAALDGDDQAGRRAWHLAATATGPDENIAIALERSAELARRRGGYGPAATGFERAAELSVARSDRGRRVVAGAQAAFLAGQADLAARLADRADELVDDPVIAEEVSILRGRIDFARGSAVTGHGLLMAAARERAQRDPRGAAAVLLEAAGAAWNACDLDRYTEATSLLAVLRLPPGDPLRPVVSTALGFADWIAGSITEGIGKVRRGVDEWLPHVSADRPTVDDDEFIQALLAMAGFTRVSGDDAAGLTLGAAAVAECRTRGSTAWLPWSLVNMSTTEAFAGQHSAALASGTEAWRLARDLDQPTAVCTCESILAWLAAVRGDEDRCRDLAAGAIRLAERYQLPAVAVIATWALGLLELSLGHPELSFDRMSDPVKSWLAVPSVRCLTTPDFVEAAVRAGRAGDLGESVDWYQEWVSATGQPWAEASLHRCRALLDEDAAEQHFTKALILHDAAGSDQRLFDRARTQVLYGQWLRRARRRRDARIQLARAHETFNRLGAVPWAERARAELRATGQTVGPQRPTPAQLTPQEMQVVRLVAEGGSNQEVAAQLFLSPRTVKYHLYKAYPKLGVTSRAELARLDLDALPGAPGRAD